MSWSRRPGLGQTPGPASATSPWKFQREWQASADGHQQGEPGARTQSWRVLCARPKPCI